MKQVRGLLSVMLLVGVLGLSPATLGQATAAGWKPKAGATFNVPRGGDKMFRIHKVIGDAIEHAKPGSYIRISLFSFDRQILAKKLIAAHKRGVHVQILLNNHQVTKAQKMLHKALGKKRFKKNFSYECTNGCRSKGENNHIKFFLFTKTGAAKDVVMTGSVNFTMNSAKNQYNDVWVRNDAPKLHAAFVRLFEDMRKDRVAKPPYWVEKIGKPYELQATPYPKFSATHDPIMKLLKPVHCSGATGGTGNANHRTIIRVVMHAWNERRGIYIAQRIRQLFAQGCDVKLMYGFAGAEVRNTFATATKRGYIPVHTTGFDTNDDGFIDLYTHQKELLISGNYGKNSATRMVVTGSSNYNDDGLRGDEEIFVIKNMKGAYQNYASNFTFMWLNKSILVKYIPYKAGVPVVLAPQPKRFGPAWEND
ncbi:MAG: phospholipase D-like domain-containing protein [Nocardioides sp.]